MTEPKSDFERMAKGYGNGWTEAWSGRAKAEARERAEDERGEALEEARVERENREWEEAEAQRQADGRACLRHSVSHPYVFADEKSERRAAYEADQEVYRRTNEYHESQFR